MVFPRASAERYPESRWMSEEIKGGRAWTYNAPDRQGFYRIAVALDKAGHWYAHGLSLQGRRIRARTYKSKSGGRASLNLCWVWVEVFVLVYDLLSFDLDRARKELAGLAE